MAQQSGPHAWTMATLDRVVVRAVQAPLRRPIIASIGQFDTWPLVLVDVELSGGITGCAYVAPYRRGAVPAIMAEISDLAAQFKGRTASPFEIFEAAGRGLNVIGVGGVSAIAIAALDMALWDGLAKAAGLPLVEMLGGVSRPQRAYNSNGLWRHEASTLGKEARELVEEGGFTALKLRLGAEYLGDDLKAIDMVRQATGEALDLMVDFNQALGPGDAIRRCRDLDDEGLYWFEEPIAYDDLAGYRALASKVRTPIQMGENHYGARDLLRFVEAGATHYAMGDLMRIGGVSGWLRAASVAAAAGIQFSNHLYPEIAAHLMAITPSAHWLEWVDWAAPILAEPLQPINGFVSPSRTPGTGVVWNERAVSRYQVA